MVECTKLDDPLNRSNGEGKIRNISQIYCAQINDGAIFEEQELRKRSLWGGSSHRSQK